MGNNEELYKMYVEEAHKMLSNLFLASDSITEKNKCKNGK